MTGIAVTCDFVSLSYAFAQRFLRQLFHMQHLPALRQIHDAPINSKFLSAACVNATEVVRVRVRSSQVASLSVSLAAAWSPQYGVYK
jgi:hypothetical protein